ncbi:hypothetical protein FGG08_000637 [Glutinoglossum americanum]|uniref:Uncharacterized protein n=1 Tax=Glutinoglossum americanum TaxID=1670608 RepID=A0A9P8L142_9PEZI|nr:hypothetical protein FGG08_000637 [Glutinoglossum americanum]
MRQERLNDAAIALYKVLSENNIKHGIFGGWAVAIRGGPRESKDIDCLVASDKQQVLMVLDGRDGFRFISQTREDYVAFFWNDGTSSESVLVELFVGSTAAMQTLVPTVFQVRGEKLGEKPASLLDVVYLFKGKLRAAATREKHSDAADLVYLESTFLDKLRNSASQFSLYYSGLALKRYPHLLYAFQRIGIDTEAAEKEVESISLNDLPPPQSGDVQKGLLG